MQSSELNLKGTDMKGSEVFPSKWLKADDLGENEPTVVISHVVMEDINDKEQKPVIYFQGKKKGMICNVTNWKRIAYIHKSDDSDDWTGKEITLYVELVDMQGKMTPALRVKAPIKRTAAAPPKTAERVPGNAATPVDLDDEIPF
jgi:hypothetical protein